MKNWTSVTSRNCSLKFLSHVSGALLATALIVSGLAKNAYSQTEKTTLITMKDGKPSASLAKTWKKLSTGKYEFQLDMAATIGKKKPLTVDAVKSSLEGKLGSTNGVAVVAKGKNGVEVTFTGDEAAFLEGVAGAKIRATKGVEIALASTTTQGGIRARATDRQPTAEEVKGTVITNASGVVTVRVLAFGTSGEAVKFKAGDKSRIAFVSDVKPNDVIYFIPGTMVDGVWQAKALVK